MSKKIAAIFLIWCAHALVAQTINPNQIRPGTVNGQVLTTPTANQPPVWQAPAASSVTEQGTSPVTVNGDNSPHTGNSFTIACPNCSTLLQMAINGLPAGQHAILWPTSNPSCTFTGGANDSCQNWANGRSGGAYQTCGPTSGGLGTCASDSRVQNFEFATGQPLPPGWSLGNITNEYLILIQSGGQTASDYTQCTHIGGTGFPNANFVLQTFVNHYGSVIDPSTEVCDTIQSKTGGDSRTDVYNTPVIAIVAFDSVDPAPPTSSNLNIAPPLTWNAANNTLYLGPPLWAGIDTTNTNAYTVNVPLLQFGLLPGDHLTLFVSHSNTGAASVTVANSVSTSAFPLQYPNGTAFTGGELSTTNANEFIMNQAQTAWVWQGATTIILTTTGTSGPATLVGNVLNVPQYSFSSAGINNPGYCTVSSGNQLCLTDSIYNASTQGATTTTVSATWAPGTSGSVASCSTFLANQGVFIAGAGTAGANYIGTVVSCLSTTLTVAPATSTSVSSGAAVKHDETAAFQAALNYFGTNTVGGSIWLNDGTYLVNGPLQDTSHSNAILLVPSIEYGLTSPQPVSIALRGFTQPTQTGIPQGAIIQTSGTSGNLLGGQHSAGGPFGVFTNVYLTVNNVTFRSYTNPTINMLNAGYIAGLRLNHVWFDAGLTISTPSSAVGVALTEPYSLNSAFVQLDDVTTIGYGTGIIFGEHSVNHSIYAANEFNCYVFDVNANGIANSGVNSINGDYIWAQSCVNEIVGPSSTQPTTVNLQNVDIEGATTFGVSDPSNLLRGTINYLVPSSSSAVTTNGATNVCLYNMPFPNKSVNCPGGAVQGSSFTTVQNAPWSFANVVPTGTAANEGGESGTTSWLFMSNSDTGDDGLISDTNRNFTLATSTAASGTGYTPWFTRNHTTGGLKWSFLAGTGIRCLHVDASGNETPANGDCITGPAVSPYTFVAETTGTSVTTPPISITAGQLLIVSCRFGVGSTGVATDSASDTFTAITAQNQSGVGTGIQMSYAIAGTTGSTTFTCTQGSSGGGLSAIVIPISGITGSSPNTNSGGTQTSNSTIVGAQTGTGFNFTTTARTIDIFCGAVDSAAGTFQSAILAGNYGWITGQASAGLATAADQACETQIVPYALPGATAAMIYGASVQSSYSVIAWPY